MGRGDKRRGETGDRGAHGGVGWGGHPMVGQAKRHWETAQEGRIWRRHIHAPPTEHHGAVTGGFLRQSSVAVWFNNA